MKYIYVVNCSSMSRIVLKTGRRDTTVSRLAIREAVTEAFVANKSSVKTNYRIVKARAVHNNPAKHS